MFWTMTCRVIASVVTFFVGVSVFQVVRPTEELRLPEPASQISTITMKRYGCLDAERKCPVYEATFRSDGTCTYIGYANDEFIGRYEGTYELKDFTYLVEQIEQQRFWDLSVTSPASPVEESTSVEVIATNGVKRITTQSWAGTPSGLRALQAMIEQQTYEAEWEQVK